MDLSLLEARVIGCLLEKEITTPDQYPLSLNGLMTACNQKSNREPVMSLTMEDVQTIVDDLTKKGLVSEVVFGGRVPKYKHRFCNTEFSQLHLSSKEVACLCVMFLRGPQSPGELRTRTNRLCNFTDNTDVEKTLDQLIQREGNPLVVKLPKETGKRDFRYMHLLGDEESFSQMTAVTEPVSYEDASFSSSIKYEERIEALEQQVSDMRLEIDELKQLWEELNS